MGKLALFASPTPAWAETESTRHRILTKQQKQSNILGRTIFLLTGTQQKARENNRGVEVYFYLRVEAIGVAIEDDVDAAAAGGGNRRILVAEIDADDGHCWLLLLRIIDL